MAFKIHALRKCHELTAEFEENSLPKTTQITALKIDESSGEKISALLRKEKRKPLIVSAI